MKFKEDINRNPCGHLVLLSGGADSATVLAIAHKDMENDIKEGFDSQLFTFHCNYGQKTEGKELQCYHLLCDHYKIPASNRFVIDISYLKAIGSSCLTDPTVKMDLTGDAIKKRYVPTSYVPFRNGNFLAIAGAIAASKKIGNIWLGVVEEDSSGYPDCRIEFISNFNHALNSGLPDGHDVVIQTPVISLEKVDIIKHGLSLGVPYEKTWSCYKSQKDVACGECDSCRLRLKSFFKAGVKDPIQYPKLFDWYKAEWEAGRYVC